MIDLVAASLKRIHMLYARFPKGLWGICVNVTFASMAFGLFSSLLVTWVAWKLMLTDMDALYDLGDFIMVNLYWDGAIRIASFVLLAFGMFALRMRQVGDASMTNIRTGQLWKDAGADARSTFLWSYLLLLVLHVLLFRRNLDAGDGLNATFWPDEPFHPSIGRRYANWLYSVAKLALNYLPYLMVLSIFLAHDRVKLNGRTFKQYLPVIGAVAILGTVIDALFNEVYHLLITYVFPPLTIPFAASALAYLFPFIVVLFFTAWCLPAYCLVLIGPFDAFQAEPPVQEDGGTAEGKENA